MTTINPAPADTNPLAPHDLGDFSNPERLVEAERAVLAACFHDGADADLVLRSLSASDFTGVRPAIFEAVKLATTEGAADVAAAGTWLRENGHEDGGEELARVVGWVSMKAELPKCISALRRKGRQRREGAILARLASIDNSVTQRRLIAEFNAVRAEPEPGTTRFKFIGAGALLESDVQPPTMLVADGLIVAGGITVLAAPAKRGKTIAALQIALALVRRLTRPDITAEWFGSEVLGAGKVVYLSGEGGGALLKQRIEAMAPDLTTDQVDSLKLLADQPWPVLTNPEDLREVADMVRATGAALLVIDPFTRFVPMEDENDNAKMNDALLPLRQLAEATRCAILIVHHQGKPKDGSAGNVTGGRGASKLGDEADALVNMEIDAKSKDRARSAVHFLCRWAQSPESAIVRIGETPLGMEFVARIGNEADQSRSGPEPKVTAVGLREALAPTGTWRTREEVAHDLGVTDDTLKRHLAGREQGSLRAALGASLDVQKDPGNRGRVRLRLVPLEEQADLAEKGASR